MRGPWVRGMAMGFVAFLLFASGRALVPGMCATQTALLQAQQDRAAGLASWRTQTCCTLFAFDNAHEAPVAPSSGAPQCAFCNLAHAIIDEPLPLYILVPAASIDDALPEMDSLLRSRDRDPNLRGRAPPFAFA